MNGEIDNALYQRIEAIARHTGQSMRQLSVALGLSSPQSFYDIKSGKVQSVSRKILEAIKQNIPGINTAWLITGEGEMLASEEKKKNLIPLYDDAATIGGMNDMVADVNNPARVTEYIDAGDWFPSATSAIHHYGDSMIEYPSGSILALKRVEDSRLIINGANYVIETNEYRITKQVQDDGDYIMAYSSNRDTYPDGRLIHAPIRIPKETIRHMDLVLGCVIRNFSNPINIR